MVRSRRPNDPLVMLLVAVALLLRAFVPGGWMPASTDTGVKVLLCSGAGAIELAGTGSANGDEDGAAGHDPCPYALALADAADVPGAPVAEAPPAFEPMRARVQAAEVFVTLRAALRPPARGPPLTA